MKLISYAGAFIFLFLILPANVYADLDDDEDDLIPNYRIIEDYVAKQSGEEPLPGSLDGPKQISAKKLKTDALIDGKVDSLWEDFDLYHIWDPIAKKNVLLRTFYNDDYIYFLVQYSDDHANMTHKSWVWNSEEEMYEQGYDREDHFVFKWNMMDEWRDLSAYSDDEYYADIWYWKSARSNPMGYADDKMHILSDERVTDATEIVSRSGSTMYLQRLEDKGSPCYNAVFPVDYQTDTVIKYDYKKADGSRADIRAKGLWSAGKWTIEFKRKLLTGNSDDINFIENKEYQFGVSLYEIADKYIDPKAENPLYGCGDIFVDLRLVFAGDNNG